MNIFNKIKQRNNGFKLKMIKILGGLALVVAYINIFYVPQVQAWGFNPCNNCHFYFAVCCPKPCPVADNAAVAAEGGVVSRIMTMLEQHNEQQAIYRKQERTMGLPGKRDPYMNPQEFSDYLELIENKDEITSPAQLVKARIRTYADTMELLPRINAALTHAEEAAIAAERTMAVAPDLRGMNRANSRMDVAKMKLGAIDAVLRALLQRQESLNNLRLEHLNNIQTGSTQYAEAGVGDSNLGSNDEVGINSLRESIRKRFSKFKNTASSNTNINEER